MEEEKMERGDEINTTVTDNTEQSSNCGHEYDVWSKEDKL